MTSQLETENRKALFLRACRGEFVSRVGAPLGRIVGMSHTFCWTPKAIAALRISECIHSVAGMSPSFPLLGPSTGSAPLSNGCEGVRKTNSNGSL